MPLFLDTEAGSAGELRAANCVNVGLINNMPDSALAQTERQLIDLLRASSANCVVRLVLFSIPEVPRTDEARDELRGRYHDIGNLWDSRLDGLIVTGNEPRSTDLKHEPYWPALTQVIDWSREHTISTIWSCLAAHAAVLQTDGIERQRLREKCFGVFACEPVSPHPITPDAALPLYIPHSRYNDLPERALKAAGYRIITRSVTAGVDMFARHDRSFHLFLQGHPEYEANTLLREYRRDIGRYLRGEREHYPNAPEGYFDAVTQIRVEAFRKRALASRRGELIADFPMQALEDGLAQSWRASAIGIYENWLGYLQGRKAERHSPATPLRRVWRDWPGRGHPAAAS